MAFQDTQNPGIDFPLDTLTKAEEAFLTSLAGISFSNGDLLYYNNGSIQRLPIGSSTNILTVSAGLPTWSASSSGGGTLAATSLLSTDATKSLYTMTSTIPVEFQTSGGGHLLYLDEANARIGLGTNSPTNILSLGNAAARKFWIENSATDVVGRALTIAAGGTLAGTSVSDVTGGNLIIQSGLGTGTGASTISFQTGTTLATGTTLQTMSTKMAIFGNGGVGMNVGNDSITANALQLGASATTIGNAVLVANNLNVAAGNFQSAVEHNVGLTTSGAFTAFIPGNDTVGGFHAVLVNNNASQKQYAIIGIRSKANGAWNASNTAVVNGDYLPGIGFAGTTTTTAVGVTLSASVLGQVDGAVSSGVLPTAIVFNTSTTSSTGLSEKMRIGSNGNVGIGATSPTNILSFGGNAARTWWLERHTTANTAGSTLTIQSGGATAAATDKNGGQLIQAPGLSTGRGFNSIRLQGLTRAASTGTSDNSLEDRLIIPSVANLTNNTTVGLFDVSLTAGSTAGGYITYTITATDGTDYHSISGTMYYDAVNKGDVYTTQFTASLDTVASSNIGGTNVPTWSLVTGTNKFTVKMSDADSLTTTVLQIRYVLHNLSGSTITQL